MQTKKSFRSTHVKNKLHIKLIKKNEKRWANCKNRLKRIESHVKTNFISKLYLLPIDKKYQSMFTRVWKKVFHLHWKQLQTLRVSTSSRMNVSGAPFSFKNTRKRKFFYQPPPKKGLIHNCIHLSNYSSFLLILTLFT